MDQITDYLIVGAGASGLAFADCLLAEADASIVLIDRRRDVGGHWCDAYPFVRLHTPSAYYGVGSIQLGEDRIQDSGRNQGFYEQASGPEVHAYFQTVLTDRLLPSGRVRFLPRHEHLEHNDGIARVRDLDTGQTHEITVRRRVVDARYQEASIPATHIPSFAVDEDAPFIPIGALPDRVHDYGRYCVIGAGKTSADACLWLLDAGIDPERIRWIRPRDAWFIDRAQLQPLDQIAALLEGAAAEAEAGAHAEDVAEFFHRLEDAGRLMRLDTAIEPDMYRVTMLSRPELADLRDIDGIVRLGHVRSIGPSHLALEDGEIAVDHDEVFVDCSARGLAPSPAVPVFGTDTIRIQQLRHASPTFNAAMIAFIEAHRDDDAERNRLAPPNPYANKPADIVPMLMRTWATAERWRAEPDLKDWISKSRLNLTHGLGAHMTEPRVRAAVERFAAHVPQAMQNMPRLVAPRCSPHRRHPPVSL